MKSIWFFGYKESLYDSEIWRSYFSSKNIEKHIQFGFICFLLEDFQQSYYSFKESAKPGSDTGLCMCGLILFYGLYKKRDVKKSCFYFSKCNQNPISLLHLGISCSEDIYIKIARKISGKKVKNGELFEYIGDLFYYGIKYPRELMISKMLYGYNTSNLLTKLGLCVSTLQYF